MKEKIYSNKNKYSEFDPINFKKEDNFFIKVTQINDIIKNISNIEDLKPNEKKIKILKEKINIIKSEQNLNESERSLKIIDEFAEKFNNYKELKRDTSNYGNNIKKILSDINGTRKSLKEIQKKYLLLFKQKISLMTISRILRYHLNLHYRKTSLKNPKILEQNYLIMSLIFLNCIVRGIELGLNLIYIDEVSFEIENNNFYTWRGNDDIIIDGPKSDNKKDLVQ